MSKRLVISTGVAAFAAGIMVGARWPHSTHLFALLLDKLGFDISDLLFTLWDPEGRERVEFERQLPAPQARAKRTKKARAVAICEPRLAKPQAVVKVRRFSSRPALSAA